MVRLKIGRNMKYKENIVRCGPVFFIEQVVNVCSVIIMGDFDLPFLFVRGRSLGA